MTEFKQGLTIGENTGYNLALNDLQRCLTDAQWLELRALIDSLRDSKNAEYEKLEVAA